MTDIIVQNLYKSFGEKKVLADFSLTLKQGTVTSLMGESGCGKTTLLNILLGFEKADKGEITGVPQKIAAVFQEDRLCEDFSALTNVTLVLEDKDKQEIAKKHLIALGLEESLHKPVKELSGGMKRRVAIARALAADGDFVLLDEAFKGLDGSTKTAVVAYVNQQCKGKTILSVTHDPWEAEAMGGEVVMMRKEL